MFTVTRITTDKIRALFRQGKLVLHEGGILSLFKHITLLLVRLLFVYRTDLLIYVNTLDGPVIPHKVANLTLRAIFTPFTPEELERLTDESFDFSLYHDIQDYENSLDEGTIMFCAFVGKELAHRTWIALKSRGVYRYFLPPSDYGHIGYVGGTVTAPKFRRKGIYIYVYSQIFHYLREKGLSKAIIIIRKDNLAPQKVQNKLGSKLLGEGCHLRLLLLNFHWVKSESPALSRKVTR